MKQLQQNPASQHQGVIEVMDAPAAASSAAGVLARLSQREEQRAALAAKRLEELQVSADPRESVEAFLEQFAARRQQLEEALAAAVQGSGGSSGSSGSSGGGDAAALAAQAEQIAELEKAVAEAAYFLPAYDLRQATLAVGSLREQQEAAVAALQPRKKFAFNRRPSASKQAAAAEEAPAAAAQSETTAGAAVQGLAAEATTDAAFAVVPVSIARGSTQQPPEPQLAPTGQQQRQGPSAPSSSSSPPAPTPVATAATGSTISGLRGQVVAPSRELAAGQEFTLSDLEDCTVFLSAPLAALFLHGLRRCKVYTGPVGGACYVEDVTDSVLALAAQQVRIHSARSTIFYLRVRSHPIIEHSTGVLVAPYHPTYPGCAEDLQHAGLDPGNDMWRQVNDFGWLRATPSPNWAVLPEGERQLALAGPWAQQQVDTGP